MSAILSNCRAIAPALRTTQIRQKNTNFAAHPIQPFRTNVHLRNGTAIHSLGGGDQNRKVLRREEEPEEYWTSESERQGKNPLSDPLALIGLLAIFAPFLILGVAIAVGFVDLNGGR